MKIPKHIALIPDGNRRWAKLHNVEPWEGHRIGIERFREFLDWCYDLGVQDVTAYSVSKENLDKRDKTEVEALYGLYDINLRVLLEDPDIDKKEIRVYFIGELDVFPKNILELISKAEERTKNYKKRSLTFCMNYSGRDEILSAIRRMLKDKIDPEKVNEKLFEGYLQTRVAEPDLLIRTAENRISNFLLWQLAYTEVYFSSKMFPDFTKDDFMNAINQYNQTQRRFGE